MLDRLEIDCERIEDLITVDEIVAINRLITDTESFEDPDIWKEGEEMGRAEIGGPEFDLDRDEDYHHVREPGILETLVENVLPYECEENSSALWLTSVLMSELAKSQAFGEGNKRTAYVTGTLFLVKCQLLEAEEAIYPYLDRELTDMLSDLAVEEKSREELHDYLEERLSGS